ncbi:thermonuclease family protein [Bacillus sp. UNC438CL73TsuS30]|uniref:thermonuclease family protein n=1 Tax=Bacillus sp. UNC438CL73TsuS30 TaxID=1340434 RepID=UPI0005554DE0|nr:thermonuclease family protein [Bacillus sp. UNC438CL73TsuS30]
MKKGKLIASLSLTVSLIFSGFASANTTLAKTTSPKLVPATVSKNIDGDTIQVKYNGKNETVRMLLIDTPEDVDPRKPVEPYGYTAAKYAKSKLPVGKHIYLQLGKKGYERDKYHRLLAYVYITKTDLYNKDIVKKGYARVAYVYKPNTDHLSELQSAQSYAKSKKLGIWSISGYVTSNGYSLSKSCSYARSNGYSTNGCGITGTKTTNTSSKGTTSSSTKVTGTTLTVKHGQQASITIKTKPGVKGTIQVIYSSGPSKASGLTAKTANSGGYITWSWRVGTSTKPGSYPVIMKANGSTIKKTLIVR